MVSFSWTKMKRQVYHCICSKYLILKGILTIRGERLRKWRVWNSFIKNDELTYTYLGVKKNKINNKNN